jgi:hypothetical protein
VRSKPGPLVRATLRRRLRAGACARLNAPRSLAQLCVSMATAEWIGYDRRNAERAKNVADFVLKQAMAFAIQPGHVPATSLPFDKDVLVAQHVKVQLATLEIQASTLGRDGQPTGTLMTVAQALDRVGDKFSEEGVKVRVSQPWHVE